MAPRYNLRRRANSVPDSPASVPGAFVTPVQSLQALAKGTSPLSPIESVSPEATSTPDTKPLYSAVVLRTPSRSSTFDASPLVLSNIFPSLSIKENTNITFENVGDEGEQTHITVSSGPAESPWTEVKYKKNQADSPGAQRESAATALTSVQCQAIDTAASRMSAAEQKMYDLRMSKVAVANDNTHSRSRSREEGSSTRQGKTGDPRNWGSVHLDPAEMDPEVQKKLLRYYRDLSGHGAPVELNNEELDTEEEQKAFELWDNLRTFSKSEQSADDGPREERSDKVLERLEMLTREVASLKRDHWEVALSSLGDGASEPVETAISELTLQKRQRAATAAKPRPLQVFRVRIMV
ncbi:hypothetical protein BC835DRAFT_1427890 [Cytidiella melzeri]|nr:hypothetical protein BC835DRAFT_1427890 [Cytidiella melzeri]